MQQAIEPTEISLDAYTMCSFLPDINSGRALPLALIGYRQSEDPWFVWLVPKEGVDPDRLDGGSVLREGATRSTRVLQKEAGKVR